MGGHPWPSTFGERIVVVLGKTPSPRDNVWNFPDYRVGGTCCALEELAQKLKQIFDEPFLGGDVLWIKSDQELGRKIVTAMIR